MTAREAEQASIYLKRIRERKDRAHVVSYLVRGDWPGYCRAGEVKRFARVAPRAIAHDVNSDGDGCEQGQSIEISHEDG